MISDTSALNVSGEKVPFTRSIVTRLPIKEVLFLTWREEMLKIEGKLLQKEKAAGMYFVTIASNVFVVLALILILERKTL